MLAKSTQFPRKDIHKGTWRAPGGTYTNQIDHVLVNSRYATSVIDVKTRRGANCDSDHFLVKSILRQRLSNIGKIKGKRRTGWDIEKLKKDSYKRAFQEQIHQQLSYENENNSIEEIWNDMKKTLTETSEERLGQRKRFNRKDWFDEECRVLIGKKN